MKHDVDCVIAHTYDNDNKYIFISQLKQRDPCYIFIIEKYIKLKIIKYNYPILFTMLTQRKLTKEEWEEITEQ